MDDRLQSKGYVKRPAGNSGWSWRVNGRTDKRPTGGGGHCRDMKSPSVSLTWDEALTSQLRHQEAGASQHHMTAAYAPLKAHGILTKGPPCLVQLLLHLLVSILLFLFSSWAQIRSTPHPLRPGAGNTTTYIVIGYMKT